MGDHAPPSPPPHLSSPSPAEDNGVPDPEAHLALISRKKSKRGLASLFTRSRTSSKLSLRTLDSSTLARQSSTVAGGRRAATETSGLDVGNGQPEIVVQEPPLEDPIPLQDARSHVSDPTSGRAIYEWAVLYENQRGSVVPDTTTLSLKNLRLVL
jgi:hypothetical protein